ncbi:MAG: hypothetical protein H0W55_07320 [Actinobacteria bacterium]|nr:hypothetical protein [Actinomycetota bacterium]
MLLLDIGESLVGSYLRYIENCDFVHYQTYGEGQGEVDVIGMRLSDRRVWLCEVAVHLAGLHYGGYAGSRDKVKQKIDRAEVLAERLFSDQQAVYEFWSLRVPPGLASMLGELEQDYVGRGLDVSFVINERFTERIEALRAEAATDMKATAEPAYRLLQILTHLR